MFLPVLVEGEARRTLIPESVVALHMTDLTSLDLVRRLERVTQLTQVARKQLDFKLTYFDTGFQVPLDEFIPDLS